LGGVVREVREGLYSAVCMVLIVVVVVKGGDKLKKIVVVVDSEKIVFEGDGLEAIDSGVGTSLSKVLVIRDGKKNKNNIAVFRHWDYWREVRENDKSVRNKILVRPEKPVTLMQLKKFVQGMKHSDLVVIPPDFKVIVLNSLGEAKIL